MHFRRKKRKCESDNLYLVYACKPGLTAIVIVDLFICLVLQDFIPPEIPSIRKNTALQFFVRSTLTNGGHLLGSDGKNVSSFQPDVMVGDGGALARTGTSYREGHRTSNTSVKVVSCPCHPGPDEVKSNRRGFWYHEEV